MKLKIFAVFMLVILMVGNICLISARTPPTVTWIANDTTTKGNWVGVYGSYAYILPLAGDRRGQEVPIGSFERPPSNYVIGSPPFYWYNNQYSNLQYASTDPPYNDEFWTLSPKVHYNAKGTKMPVDEGFAPIQQPLFEWEWSVWHATQTDPREVFYPAHNAWKLASWDDGGERGCPAHGYMEFYIRLPTGKWRVTLYAFDYEGYSRSTQLYQVMEKNGNVILAERQIGGTQFDEGIHVTFEVTNPNNNSFFTFRVYNDAGYGREPWIGTSLNVVLSGIFVDKVQ